MEGHQSELPNSIIELKNAVHLLYDESQEIDLDIARLEAQMVVIEQALKKARPDLDPKKYRTIREELASAQNFLDHSLSNPDESFEEYFKLTESGYNAIISLFDLIDEL